MISGTSDTWPFEPKGTYTTTKKDHLFGTHTFSDIEGILLSEETFEDERGRHKVTRLEIQDDDSQVHNVHSYIAFPYEETLGEKIKVVQEVNLLFPTKLYQTVTNGRSKSNHNTGLSILETMRIDRKYLR